MISGTVAAQDIVGQRIAAADTTGEAASRRYEMQTLEIRNEDCELIGNLVSRTGKFGTPLQVRQDGLKFKI